MAQVLQNRTKKKISKQKHGMSYLWWAICSTRFLKKGTFGAYLLNSSIKKKNHQNLYKKSNLVASNKTDEQF